MITGRGLDKGQNNMGKLKLAKDLQAEIPAADRTWLGDYDPYLGQLAYERCQHRAAPAPRAPRAPRLTGPIDDGDPYLAELTRRPAGELGDA